MTSYAPTPNDMVMRQDILLALEAGRSQDIERLRGQIKWDTLVDEGQPLTMVMGRKLFDTSQFDKRQLENIQDACLALIDCALQDDRKDILEHSILTPEGPRNRAEPFAALTISGMDRLLVKFLDAGLDPQLPFEGAQPDSFNLLQLAEVARQTATVAMFHAFAARRFANGILNEIENNTVTKNSPA